MFNFKFKNETSNGNNTGTVERISELRGKIEEFFNTDNVRLGKIYYKNGESSLKDNVKSGETVTVPFEYEDVERVFWYRNVELTKQ